jgi:predicted short-subunit dehydrogenase-like oxidoreductase (DUF2520 family)
MKGEIKTAALIGAGNVGWHMGLALKEKDIRVLQVISKSPASCRKLAGLLESEYSTSLQQLTTQAGIIIIAVPDKQIGAVIGQCDFRDNLAVHTAGSVPMDIFKGRAVNYGVLYPLMTFSRNKPVDFTSVPLLIEANTIENKKKLNALANRLSGKVKTISSEQRIYIHLSAVIACNFSNHMYALAEAILTRQGIPFELLRPLIRETSEKIKRMSPRAAQTGPAHRNDKETLEKHLGLLAGYPDIAELYRQISQSIITFTKPEKR